MEKLLLRFVGTECSKWFLSGKTNFGEIIWANCEVRGCKLIATIIETLLCSSKLTGMSISIITRFEICNLNIIASGLTARTKSNFNCAYMEPPSTFFNLKILSKISIMYILVDSLNPDTKASKSCEQQILWHSCTINSIIPSVKSLSRNGIDPKLIWSMRSFKSFSKSSLLPDVTGCLSENDHSYK